MIGPLTLVGDAATEQLAQDIAMVAAPGWVIRLEGDLGAGKTTFARAFIRTLAKDPGLEVPSPTYTLVQRYDEADPPVLHADLYRLSDPSEMTELGLDDADDPAVRLIEWPTQAGEGAFPGAITLALGMQGEEARQATLTGPQDILGRIVRSLEIRAFLATANHEGADRQRLLGDASTRRYERVVNKPLIVMDAARQPDGPVVRPDTGSTQQDSAQQEAKPYSQLVHLAESVHAFSAVGTALGDKGLAAPTIHAADLEKGLLLIEDLGGDTILHEDGRPNPERYLAAVELLAGLHRQGWPGQLPVPGGDIHHLHRYDTGVLLTEISLLPDWYVAHRGIDAADFDRAGFFAAWREELVPLDDEPPTLTLRDYHSPNIIWRAQETGPARLGLIDFQDALLGPPAYDVAALALDARVTIPADLQDQLLNAYVAASGSDAEWVRARVALMGAQRNSKILGIFARLNARDGKPGYLKHLPRVEGYMRQCLTHPALADLKPFYDQLLPETA
ncbi:MAG: tRNA (adenosine(37)-N6)-threonylcarbamoyltransferase complex ATPase subunit type 1 TsaE [Pseudomonadota bacterium]